MGLFRKKAPPQRDFGQYATDALKESMSALSTDSLAGEQLSATDGLLYDHWQDDVDWQSVWAAVARRRPDVPPFACPAYWPRQGKGNTPAPISGVAFMSAAARLRVANDPHTADTLVSLMATNRGGDPDPDVRAAAARRLR
jgi:hypothetical protein